MKKLILCFFFLSAVYGLYAQASETEARRATEEAIAQYQLNHNQAEEMYVIQARRLRNLSAIETLRASDYPLYLEKKNATREGMLSSIRRLLKASQLEILEQQLAERRKQEAALKAKLKDTGATREEIQMAIWDIE